jgi:hypothetical protein
MNATIVGFITDFSTVIVSSLSPLWSIVGAIWAMPSRVRTPRIVRTGANRPGTSRPMDASSRSSTTSRADREVIAIDPQAESPTVYSNGRVPTTAALRGVK